MTVRSPVTVLIPTYNRARYLAASLESVLAQSVPPAQVVVIDDGSTDPTREVLRPYLDRIEYLRKENGGKSTALNLAMARVQCDYVWVFDDDDVAYPHALESQLEVLRHEPEAGFAYSGYARGRTGVDGSLDIMKTLPAPDVPDDQLFIELLDQCILMQQGMLVRTQCYHVVGSFDERLVRSQDYEMALRLAYHFRSARNPEITFMLRIHEGDRGSARQNVRFASRNDTWAELDKGIATTYHARLALHEYLGKRARATAELTAPEVRYARIRRASVMARKGLWNLALDDLRWVAERGPDQGSLSDPEKHAIQQMVQPIYWAPFAALISDHSITAALRRSLRTTRLGRRIRTEIVRGLEQQLTLAVRERKRKLAARIVELAARILGPVGAVDHIARSIDHRLRVRDSAS